jgi:hypothetical protein
MEHQNIVINAHRKIGCSGEKFPITDCVVHGKKFHEMHEYFTIDVM